MFQYTIATDTWTPIPDLPIDHRFDGTCTVSDDGRLYVGTHSPQRLQRLKLDPGP